MRRLITMAVLLFGALASAPALQVASAQETDVAVRLETELQELLVDERYEYEEAEDLFVNIILTLDTPTALALLEKHYYRDRGIMNKTSGIRKAFRGALVFTARAEASRLFVDRFLSGEYMRIEVPDGEEWTENLRHHRLAEMILLAPSVLEPDRATELLTALYETVGEKSLRFRRHIHHSIAAALAEIGTDEAFAFLDTVRDEINFGGYLRWRLMYSPDDRAADLLLYRLKHLNTLVDVDYSWPDDDESTQRRLTYVESTAMKTLQALVGETTGMLDEHSEWLHERRDQKKGVERWSMGTLRRIRSELDALTPRLLEYGVEEEEVKRVKERLGEIIEKRRENG